MPQPDSKAGHLLPYPIDPPRTCVQLYIPDAPQHIRAFWGTLDELAHWYSWQRDDAKTARLIAAVWREVIDEAWDRFRHGNPCPCEDDTMSECCDEILAALNTIIGLMQNQRSADPLLQVQQRQDIFNIINAPGFVPTDLDPDVPDVSYTEGSTDQPGEDAIRRQALCHALFLLYLAMVHYANIQLTWTAISVSAEALLGGSWVLPLLVWVGAGIVGTLGNAALSDEQAVRNVICSMVDDLVDADVTQEAIQAAAANAEVGGNETLIGEAIRVYMSDPANWGAVLLDMGRAFREIKHGADLYCPCDDEAGVTCEAGASFQNFEYDYDGGNGWTPDSIGAACQNFGHILEGGGTLSIGVERCINFVQLNRFFGGTSSGEATLAKFTLNGHVRYVAIEPDEHCTLEYDPPQTIGPGQDLRIDLIGGGEIMCYTGLVTHQATPA